MPELSRFFGIIIRMFVEPAVSTPKPQQRLVEAWAEIHRSELQHDWDLLQSGQPPIKIDPLR